MEKKDLEVLKQRAKEVLIINSLGDSTKPAAQLYPHQWNWDSAFIAIGLSHFDDVRAQKEIITLLKGQWQNGMVPHIVFNQNSGKYFPGPEFWDSKNCPGSPLSLQTSGITQPPMLTCAAYEVYKNSKDKTEAIKFLKEIFPKLKKNHQFLLHERDHYNESLSYILHPWESGLDNSPRWDIPLQQVDLKWVPKIERVDSESVDPGQRPTDADYEKYVYLIENYKILKYNQGDIWKNRIFAVQSILFNSIMFASLESLLQIALLLEEDTLEIEKWISRTKANINFKLWDENSASFGDYNLYDNQLLITNTVAQFSPLFAGIPSKERAALMVDKLLSPDYWPVSGYPLSSVSQSDKAFNPENYWRGPVWININWLIIKGLQKYGYLKEAKLLCEKTIEIIRKNGFNEYFNPLTGKACGAKQFSWTASLMIDLIELYQYEN